MPKSWGSLARKSVRQLGEEDNPGAARRAWQDAVERARGDREEESWEPEVWIRDDEPPAAKPSRARRSSERTAGPSRDRTAGPRAATGAARARDRDRASRGKAPFAGSSGARRRSLPEDVVAEVGAHVPATRADRYKERLAEAAKAYERDRYTDASKLLKPLAEAVPGSSAVRELYGLTLYRRGRWNEAIRELEAFRALEPGNFDQHATLADCYRAKRRWRAVAELWEELRIASPSADLVAEGRIVMAGALADQDRVGEAIELLEKTKTDSKRPRPHHLRVWYALADLYERAGEIPRARDLFRRVLLTDPELYDAKDRLDAIT